MAAALRVDACGEASRVMTASVEVRSPSLARARVASASRSPLVAFKKGRRRSNSVAEAGKLLRAVIALA